MNIWLVVAISLAGGAGAATRFTVDGALTKWFTRGGRAKRFGGAQGWGILAVNITGSLALGLLAGPLASMVWGPVVTVGFLGGYTTFSTASLNSVQIALDSKGRRGLVYALSTYLFSVAAAMTGFLISSALF